ncbi:MAG TPA: hypothetical protein VK747_00490, partial [Blastocatellia bacterium]|nr:hypothetical protein [Blastocatellia bacterium]
GNEVTPYGVTEPRTHGALLSTGNPYGIGSEVFPFRYLSRRVWQLTIGDCFLHHSPQRSREVWNKPDAGHELVPLPGR